MLAELKERFLSASLRETLEIRGFGLTKIPLVFFVSPTVIEANERRVEIKIPLCFRTRNHLGSMYFGALAIGADLAGGAIAWRLIQASRAKIDLIFKDFRAEFLKRAEGDVHFSCDEGPEIQALVARAIQTGERQTMPVHIIARVPSKLGDEPVAKLQLTLSIKKR